MPVAAVPDLVTAIDPVVHPDLVRSVVNHPLLPSSLDSAVFTIAGLELAQGHLSHESLLQTFL